MAAPRRASLRRRAPAPDDQPAAVTTWTVVDEGAVRAVEYAPRGQSRALVCLLPGLSLTDYVAPTARALAVRGLHCAVLDLPGLARPARVTEAHPARAGEWAAAWLRTRPVDLPLVLMGHSTGALAALAAATTTTTPPSLLVLAGPVFVPAHRRLSRLALAAPTAYRRESPREVPAALRLLRHAGRTASLVRSAVHLRPEDLVAGVTTPLVLTAGTADAMAPWHWLEHLHDRATAAPRRRVVVLPGSHNNLFTHPGEVADLVVAGLEPEPGPPRA
ncbi:alpha/beta fold hydrolase [Phycicoccus sp. 3266]|uniref:alpha/beta hydrolase n=1 Tax=Phycicoccus sp. 3266 TaxID=2817751 RepID=UPI0028563B42|nr:alpha/beta fold hydrolase [Phycicoccus sp. 3266]MDR6862821.1 alpha-beta hydrolase superfamily lysophospholipase [Phycicoccus sp. 3266]